MNGYPTSLVHSGSTVSSNNPLPVSLGGDSIVISNVTLPANLNISTALSNPLYVLNVPGNYTMGGVYLQTSNGVNISPTNPLPINPISNIGVIVNNTLSSPVPVLNTAGNYLMGAVYLQTPEGYNIAGSNPLPVSIQPYRMMGDAFGRLRVSEPFTLGDYKHVYGQDPNFIDFTSNGGTVTFVPNRAACILQTSSTPNSRVIHQTCLYHQYMPGKSQLIFSSINFNGPQNNVIKRTGYYDDNNGLFLELNDLNILSFNIRSKVTGSVQTQSIPQSLWNIDRLDGTGPSGISLDMTKVQLLIIDFQWLGVGRIRFGFSINGLDYLAHEVYHTNIATDVYMSNPSLPVRCEILNTSVGGTVGTMTQICSTVLSEGGYIETGIDYSTLTNTRTITGTIGASLPMICIRLSPTFQGTSNYGIIRLKDFNVFAQNQSVSFKLLRLSSSTYITGGSWDFVDPGRSMAQVNSNATALTDLGIPMACGFSPASGQGASALQSATTTFGSDAKRNYIAQNITATDSEAYAVYVTNMTSSSANVAVSIHWREVY